MVGATIGATVIFLVARTALGEPLLRRAGPRAAQLAQGFRADAFSYLLFLRLVPAFPFFLVNLVPAFAGVRLSTFVAATALGIIPGALVYAFAGTGLDSVIAAQQAATTTPAWPPAAPIAVSTFNASDVLTPATDRRADRARPAGAGAGAGEATAGALARDRCDNVAVAMRARLGHGRNTTPDICVIGGGSGGLSVAAAAAAFGVSVRADRARTRWAATASTPAACRRRRCWRRPSAPAHRAARGAFGVHAHASMSISPRCTSTCSA